jgi:hypothetical protein
MDRLEGGNKSGFEYSLHKTFVHRVFRPMGQAAEAPSISDRLKEALHKEYP